MPRGSFKTACSTPAARAHEIEYSISQRLPQLDWQLLDGAAGILEVLKRVRVLYYTNPPFQCQQALAQREYVSPKTHRDIVPKSLVHASFKARVAGSSQASKNHAKAGSM